MVFLYILYFFVVPPFFRFSTIGSSQEKEKEKKNPLAHDAM